MASAVEEVFMAIKFSVFLAVIALSVTHAYAVESNTKGRAPSPPSTDIEMVYVKGGCYKMGNTFDIGSPDEKPVHEVCVDDFYMGKYEVTQGQWKTVMGSNPSSNSSCGDNCPVENVSWNDAQDFISKLNSRSAGNKSSGNYRLPTEAEWEYAARSGGNSERFSGENEDVGGVAWFNDNSNESHPVGQKAPNGLGIYDMSGNVWEWTNDWYGNTYYSSSPRKNPTGPSSGDRRVIRGGSFGEYPFDLRTSYRNYLAPDFRGGGKGFRLLRTAPTQAR
jgi:formylglycine-generating enzyme required for sulfatase activity